MQPISRGREGSNPHRLIGVRMKKSFKLENLDCANCAAKMQERIAKIDGVNSVTISFMTSRITLDAEDSRFDTILDEAAEACARIEPDCTIVR